MVLWLSRKVWFRHCGLFIYRGYNQRGFTVNTPHPRCWVRLQCACGCRCKFSTCISTYVCSYACTLKHNNMLTRLEALSQLAYTVVPVTRDHPICMVPKKQSLETGTTVYESLQYVLDIWPPQLLAFNFFDQGFCAGLQCWCQRPSTSL
jgi:hypothetical protein